MPGGAQHVRAENGPIAHCPLDRRIDDLPPSPHCDGPFRTSVVLRLNGAEPLHHRGRGVEGRREQ